MALGSEALCAGTRSTIFPPYHKPRSDDGKMARATPPLWPHAKPLLTVPTWAEAQRLANRGTLVVASYLNQDRRKPGHIAVVRPSAKDAKAIETEGPDIIAAGRRNYNRTSLVQGFKSLPKEEIRFFAYRPPAPTPALEKSKDP